MRGMSSKPKPNQHISAGSKPRSFYTISYLWVALTLHKAVVKHLIRNWGLKSLSIKAEFDTVVVNIFVSKYGHLRIIAKPPLRFNEGELTLHEGHVT